MIIRNGSILTHLNLTLVSFHEDLWLRSSVQHHAKRSLVFKWRRAEGRTLYPPSLEGCGWSKRMATDGFLGYKKKIQQVSYFF